jgi:uncharacterized membrane protein
LENSKRAASAGRHILIGVVTAAPLAVTWIILEFLFSQLSRLGRPWITVMARWLAPEQPLLAAWLQNDAVLSIIAAVAVVVLLLLLGWGTSFVIGQRLLQIFEAMIGRIPVVEAIYRSTKRFLTITSDSTTGDRKVVLIEFPSPDMKAIGLVTRVMKDEVTGEEIAAVYVPTSPNPTSGYVEIVPVSKIVFTDWSFDQAMSFIVTGGTNSPESLPYSAAPQHKPGRRPRTKSQSKR